MTTRVNTHSHFKGPQVDPRNLGRMTGPVYCPPDDTVRDTPRESVLWTAFLGAGTWLCFFAGWLLTSWLWDIIFGHG